MIQIRNLIHSYGDTSIQYPDWDVDEGKHAMILGNSGCGKTTLLHLMGGLMKVPKGSITISGEKISEKSSSQLDRFRGENIGLIFQKPHLVSSLSVKENMLLSQYLGKKKRDSDKVEETLSQLGILELKNRKIHQISQGQAQRVSIARAVLNSPKLLLADEPTASLDDENCDMVIKLLKNQAKKYSSTLVIATHDHRVKSEFGNMLEL
ncbi:MAG: ABC transporter ATP-binding protein [Ekhidna sp.]